MSLHHFQFKLVFSQFKFVFAKFKLALPVKPDTSKTVHLLSIIRSNRHIFLANGGPNVAVGMLKTTLAKVRRNRLWKEQISGAVEILCTVLLDGHSGTGGCENGRSLVSQKSHDGGLEHGEHVLDGVKHGRVGTESNELGISKLFLIEDFLNRGVDGSVVAHKGNLAKRNRRTDVAQHLANRVVARVGLEGPKTTLVKLEPVTADARNNMHVGALAVGSNLDRAGPLPAPSLAARAKEVEVGLIEEEHLSLFRQGLEQLEGKLAPFLLDTIRVHTHGLAVNLLDRVKLSIEVVLDRLNADTNVELELEFESHALKRVAAILFEQVEPITNVLGLDLGPTGTAMLLRHNDIPNASTMRKLHPVVGRGVWHRESFREPNPIGTAALRTPQNSETRLGRMALVRHLEKVAK
jgi:hypothetical protein